MENLAKSQADPGGKKDKTEAGIEKLDRFLELLSIEMSKEGVPVNNEMKIDMNLFESVYSRSIIEEDLAAIAEAEQEWYGQLAGKMESEGEELEKLKTAIFNKKLGNNFLVVRASRHDDTKRGDKKNKRKGVDNVILEKDTGNIVCALDEVGATSGPRYEAKEVKTMNVNKEGGAYLKYGLRYEPDKKGKPVLKLGDVKRVPLFYLALRSDLIDKGIKDFIPSLTETSKTEEMLFEYFIQSMESQVKKLLLEIADREENREIRSRIKNFRKTLERLKK